VTRHLFDRRLCNKPTGLRSSKRKN